jgi:hypothetical protein
MRNIFLARHEGVPREHPLMEYVALVERWQELASAVAEETAFGRYFNQLFG